MLPRNTPMLPTLIFAESHEDPITGKILAKLASELKTLGYEVFFDEMPESGNLESSMKELEASEELYQIHRQEFLKFGINIENKNALSQYLIALVVYGIININAMPPSDVLNSTEVTIARRSAGLTFKTFLLELKNNGITYKGIDIDMKNKEGARVCSLPIMCERDTKMSDAYLKETASVFGRIGLAHVAGIQNKILNNISLEAASARFCFFNIYSMQPLDCENNLEERIRTGQLIFPLGITPIDATRKNGDEILGLIIKQIREKQEKLRGPVMMKVDVLDGPICSVPQMRQLIETAAISANDNLFFGKAEENKAKSGVKSSHSDEEKEHEFDGAKKCLAG